MNNVTNNEATITMDSNSISYLTRLLGARYYRTNDLSELSQINTIFKILGYKTESWLEKVN